MLIIGLCGPMGSGKSTIARELANRLNGTVMSFAGPIKEEARKYGWDGKKDAKGRKFLQLLGTQIGRAYVPDYWIKKFESCVKAQAELDQRSDAETVIIVDDLRFPNEADCIHMLGGRVIRLCWRNEVPAWRLVAQELFGWLYTFVHVSEMPLPLSKIDSFENNVDWEPYQVAERIIYITAHLHDGDR